MQWAHNPRRSAVAILVYDERTVHDVAGDSRRFDHFQEFVNRAGNETAPLSGNGTVQRGRPVPDTKAELLSSWASRIEPCPESSKTRGAKPRIRRLVTVG